METPRCASLLLFCDEILTVEMQLAICATNRTICVAVTKKKKQLKKLLHFYWKVCPKYDDNDKLEREIILVVYVSNLSDYHESMPITHSNARRNDLVNVIRNPIRLPLIL